MLSKTTLIILIPLVALMDVAAIMSYTQQLNPENKGELLFLFLSFVFFAFAGVILFKNKKKPKPQIISDPIKELDEKRSIDSGRF
jgi:hypothetical protein